ncbi:MAG: 4Fe-4S dicluster domain-containing protein [candidate division Zixibacteria bacterium]|nr:4Fe-4S dicluster domain-containing protein [candidate division Zixibacteria bacterium]
MKNEHKHIATKEDELLRCLKCGTCLSVCPVYAETRYEPAAPRGRVALIEKVNKGELELSEVFRKKINLCLNCKSCVEACPSQVRADDLILCSRADLVQAGKFTFLERLIFRFLLKRGRLLPPVARWATFAGRMANKILPEKNPLTLFLPFPDGWKERIYPKIAKKPFRKRVPEVVMVKNPKMRVGYFFGCGTNLVYPEIGEAMIKVLTHNDIEVIIPKKQVCCGTSIYNSGDFETGIKHAKKNLQIFKDAKVDCIVVNCASCGLTLKKEYKELLGVDFDIPVYDISEFLTKVIDMKKDFKAPEEEIVITYHDPCHLNRGQGIKSEPRKILGEIPGVRFVEMKDADRCCGGGGSFHLKYYPVSKGIMQKKLDNMESIDADFLVTGCPGCMMRFEETFLQNKDRKRVKNTIQLLADAYLDGEKPKSKSQ